MNGAAAARISSRSSVLNVWRAFTVPPPLAPYSLEFELVVLVPNQGRKSEPTRTSPAPIPRNSPGDSLDRATYGPGRSSWPRNPAPSQDRPAPETAVTIASCHLGS